jgi:hypothetical protein
MDHLGRRDIDGFGESMVIGISDFADGRNYVIFGLRSSVWPT